MGMEPAQQGEICRTLGEIPFKWDKFLYIKTNKWATRLPFLHLRSRIM